MEESYEKDSVLGPETPVKPVQVRLESISVEKGLNSHLGSAESLQRLRNSYNVLLAGFSGGKLSDHEDVDTPGASFSGAEGLKGVIDCNAGADADFDGISDCRPNQVGEKIEVPSAEIPSSKIHRKGSEFASGPDSVKASTPSEKKNIKKRNTGGIDLNKKPRKRLKMKRHRPKILDDSKPPKTPKSQVVEPSTPKPRKPSRAMRTTERKTERKDGPKVSKKSCGKELQFNLENHILNGEDTSEAVNPINQQSEYGRKNGVEVSAISNVGAEEVDVNCYHYNNLRSSLSEERMENKAAGSSEEINTLEVNSSLEEDNISCIVSTKECEKPYIINPEIHGQSIREAHQPDKRRNKSESTIFFKMINLSLEQEDFDSCSEMKKLVSEYHLQKNGFKSACKDELNDVGEAMKRNPEEDSSSQSVRCFSSVIVYKRILRPNECLKNSRKLGPNCPSIFKKTRMSRRKGNCWIAMKLDQSEGNRDSHGTAKRTLKRNFSCKLVGSRKKIVRNLKTSTNSATGKCNLSMKQKLRAILPTKRQMTDAIKEPLSFSCIVKLFPIVKLKRRRSQMHSRTRKFASKLMYQEFRSFKEAPQENVRDLGTKGLNEMDLSPGNVVLDNKFHICPTNCQDHVVGSEINHKKFCYPEAPQENVQDLATNSFIEVDLSLDNVVFDHKVHKYLMECQDHVVGTEMNPEQSCRPAAHCQNSEVKKINDDGSLHEKSDFHKDSLSELLLQHQDGLITTPICSQQGQNFPSQDNATLGCEVWYPPPAYLSLSTNEELFMKDAIDFVTRKWESLCISDQKAENVVVPFKAPKKRASPPKVGLDPMSMKVWKLLMGDKGSEPPKEMDEDEAKFWEQQREIFHRRAEGFIARMHLIQGNRRFSQWKGSVVDSVVGVFLTQNVSDHLSSSAFMDLASRFPPQCCKNHCDSHQITVRREESTGCTKDESSQSDHGDHTGCKDAIVQDTIDVSCVENSRTEVPQFSIEDQISIKAIAQDVLDACCNGNSTTTSSHHTTKKPTTDRELLQLEESTYLQKFCSIGDKNVQLNEDVIDLEDCMGRTTEFLSSFGVDLAVKKDPSSDTKTTEVSINNSQDTNKSNNRPDGNTSSLKSEPTPRRKKGKNKKEEKRVNWDELRKTYLRDKDTSKVLPHDAVDWEAVRQASVEEVADVISKRGMNNILAKRIKDFLDRIYRDHGSIDLEWLRDIPPNKAKRYLLSIDGLGLKSVECIRLLTLHHVAFPVDTNVGRIVVRLGWVPLEPLPGDVQIHLLNTYPLVDTIQPYLWPRLCHLDHQMLYELHYQMITFGKAFCTKRNPNCNACPMRGECRHFASAYASSRLRLKEPGKQGDKGTAVWDPPDGTSHIQDPMELTSSSLFSVSGGEFLEERNVSQNREPIVEVPQSPEPASTQASVIEFPESPEPAPTQASEIEFPESPAPGSAEVSERNVENLGYESEEEIPTVRLNSQEFKENIMNILETSNSCPVHMSKALVALSPEAASIPVPKLKHVNRLRTTHQVYELPNSHPLLEGFEKRLPDDPSPYLLAIWPTETAHSSQTSNSQEIVPYSMVTSDEQKNTTMQGTLLIPCRTATRGSFPLNGTYFQVNELFADYETSIRPKVIPREWLWNLRRRILYCGSSATSIFRGMAMEEIQYCCWRGFICVKGFNRATRAPKPLPGRLHLYKNQQDDGQ